MKISEIVVTPGWKNFMKYLYGWGAAVVLLGALFKIQHWPGASVMLILGMTTEVFIFFFSAFEPMHEDLDWTLVFPELAGIEEQDVDMGSHGAHGHGASGGHNAAMERKGASEIISETINSAGLKKLDVMLESMDVNSKTFESLGTGLNKLTNTANNITDITKATVATNEYIDTMKSASASVDGFAKSFVNSNDGLASSISDLSNSYKNAADAISTSTSNAAELINNSGSNVADMIVKSGKIAADNLANSGKELLSSYQTLADSIQGSATNITSESKAYSSKIDEVNKKLTALNSVYELQLQENNQFISNTKEIYSGFNKMFNNLKDSADETKKYKEEVAKLSSSISELNTVYGNMLSSLNMIN